MTKPLQVYLDDDDLERLERWAQAKGWSKSQAVRAAIRALTRPPGEDALLGLAGMIDGLPEDLSENFERYMSETYVIAESSPRYGRTVPRGRTRVRR